MISHLNEFPTRVHIEDRCGQVEMVTVDPFGWAEVGVASIFDKPKIEFGFEHR